MSLNCLFIFIHPFIPESPRWLVSGRKFGEAGKLINEIRKKMIKIILFVITINSKMQQFATLRKLLKRTT